MSGSSGNARRPFTSCFSTFRCGRTLSSVLGIFASGDVARVPHSVSFAVGDGAMAGMQLHRSLLWPSQQGES